MTDICVGLSESRFTGTLGYGKLKTFVRGDPYLTGFEGEEFEFQGSANRFYNLISDEYVQVNAFFEGWNGSADTIMGRIGVKIGSRLHQTELEMNYTGECKVCGNSFKGKYFFPIGIGDRIGEVLWSPNFAGFDPNIPNVKYAGTFENAAMYIDAGRYRFAILKCSEPVHEGSGYNPYFLNFIAEIVDKKVRPHGIIGQTADFDGKTRENLGGKQGEGIIEGGPKDYEVSSLFADDFRFNRFGNRARKAKIM